MEAGARRHTRIDALMELGNTTARGFRQVSCTHIP